MIVDTSAVLAVLFNEPDAEVYPKAMADAARIRMSAANWLEAAMVIDRRGDAEAKAGFEQFEKTFRVTVVDVTRAHSIEARQAWSRFGKGSGHPAQLNFGDCIAYATAKDTAQPLLFKGRDFIHTDIEPALKD